MKEKLKPGLHYIQNEHHEWYACFIARNGRETWRTSETYKRIHGAENAAVSLVKEHKVFVHKFEKPL